MDNVDSIPTPTPMKVALWNLQGCTEPYQNIMVIKVGTLFHKLNISYLQEVKVLIFCFEESLNIHYQMQPILLAPIMKERELLQLSVLPH